MQKGERARDASFHSWQINIMLKQAILSFGVGVMKAAILECIARFDDAHPAWLLPENNKHRFRYFYNFRKKYNL